MRRFLKALLAGAAALTVPLASADAFTLYYAGNEDTSVTLIGSATYHNNSCASNECRSAFVRGTPIAANSSTVADPPANRFQTPTFTSVSDLWVHAHFNMGSGVTTSAAGEQGLLIRSPDGVSRLILRQTATFGQIKVSSRNSAGTITDLTTASSNFSGYQAATHIMDLHVNYTCSGSGAIALYFDGVQVINFSGNPCTDSATQLNQVEFASLTAGTNSANSCGVAGGANAGTCWSELIIADSDTRGMGLWTLAPQAAGNTQSWTPNTVGNVNPALITDTNFVSSTTSGQLSEWTTLTTPPTGSWNLMAVVQEARVQTSTSGPTTFEWLVRTKDGTNHVTGSVTPTVGTWANFNNQIWATNPFTSAAWTISDIATGFNLGIESTP
jgi:hypothetical protein